MKKLDSYLGFGRGLQPLSESGFFQPLSTSEIFNFANSSITTGGENLSNVLPKVVVDSSTFLHVSMSRLTKDSQFYLFDSRGAKMKNRENIKMAVLKGDIVMVYSETRLPLGIPYIVKKSGNSYTIYAIISEYAKVENDGQVSITNVASVNAVLFSAYVALVSLYGWEPNKDVIVALTETYAKMFAATVAANSNINDNEMKQKLEYIGTRFYLAQAFELNESDKHFYNYFKEAKFERTLNKLIVDGLEAQFPLESFKNINTLFDAMKTNYPSIKNLSVRPFIERWNRKFGPGSIFAIDYAGFMYYIMICVLMGATQVNVKAVEAIMSKESTVMFQRIQNL